MRRQDCRKGKCGSRLMPYRDWRVSTNAPACVKELEMSVQTILDRKGTKVLTTRAGASIKRAVDAMRRDGVAALVVMNADEIVGIISERDIVQALSSDP